MEVETFRRSEQTARPLCDCALYIQTLEAPV